MGKNKVNQLGKSLVRDRFDRQRRPADTLIHTSELNDGAKWTKYQSVTDQKDLDEFFMTAQLAGTEFTAERRNVSIVTNDFSTPSKEAQEKVKKFIEENQQMLRIPRRPKWDEDTTPEELEMNERNSFLEWRRSLAQFQENNEIVTITPFEKNIEVWKQLWRVIERSALLVQIVDARNPLVFRCVDLEVYVKEVSTAKKNLLLINKADLLTPKQRLMWADYFEKNGIPYVFWSAVLAQKKIDQENSRENSAKNSLEEALEHHEEGENLISKNKKKAQKKMKKKIEKRGTIDSDEENNNGEDEREFEENEDQNETDEEEDEDENETDTEEDNEEKNKTETKDDLYDDFEKIKIYNREEILELFRKICDDDDNDDNWEDVSEEEEEEGDEEEKEEKLTIGFVGYPNVGKSSTINVLCQEKKVAVAATPGKTKHFQTLNVEDLTLCDCPGLVFPNYSITKSEMVCNGILPIDQLRDCIGPITNVVDNIPRDLLNLIYGINIIAPAEFEDPNRAPTAREFLLCYAAMRGFMKAGHGIPDEQRAARLVLKDFVNGKLLYCCPPPNVNGKEFNKESHEKQIAQLKILKGKTEEKEPKPSQQGGRKFQTADGKAVIGSSHNLRYANEVDDNFFRQSVVQAKIKGKNTIEDMRRIKNGEITSLPPKKSHLKKKMKQRNLSQM